jgi:glycerophosphoryl diester phosphodiesterase
MKKLWRNIGLGASALCCFIFINNSAFFVAKSTGSPEILAHRGVSQQFDRANIQNDTCTASRMVPPTHEYLENTVASMAASFAAGADVVEVDIHPTTDGQFAVFHDWTLECRTNGSGVTREHSMSELRRLDIGYGYTADGGKTYPFRGKGIGLMPTLDDVLTAFPERRFLINIKSNDPAEGRALAAFLRRLPSAHADRLMVYGGDSPIAALRGEMPDLKVMSRNSLRSCLLSYISYGWTGVVPGACQNTVVFVPINVAPWLWGWPDRFLRRMENAGSSVFVIGAYHGGDFSSGIDTREDVSRLPRGFTGGVMTNEIEAIAPLLSRPNGSTARD